MTLHGRSLIGYTLAEPSGRPFQAVNPATGQPLPGEFFPATPAEVDRAAALAEAAFPAYAALSGAERGVFLRAIADQLETLTEQLQERAPAETGLPPARIAAESGRTCGQLRLFAGLVEEGSWVDARIDHADPTRQPLPKPDVRCLKRPLGPVVVFCASNFPLAFSVAGGDTAAALAAGCPVLVKAHHAHPGTAELVGRAVLAAARDRGLPEGVFSLLHGEGRTVGAALVQHPAVRAVGFTGSRAGGRALFDLAAARPEPIPVYAEMSSVNPVFCFPSAVAEAETLAAGLSASLNLGVGQFCTNPGLVFHPPGSAAFRAALARAVGAVGPAVMLHEGIRASYAAGLEQKLNHPAVEPVAVVEADPGPGRACAGPAVFACDLEAFLADPTLAEEVFGPSTLLIEAEPEQYHRAAAALEGQLTASLHGSPEELASQPALLDALQRKVGRIIVNQFPTGVEVCHAMVHGGPYPATTDGRSTSVGTAAIDRFVRLLSYQNCPDELLPAELREANPRGLWRLVDGERRR